MMENAVPAMAGLEQGIPRALQGAHSLIQRFRLGGNPVDQLGQLPHQRFFAGKGQIGDQGALGGGSGGHLAGIGDHRGKDLLVDQVQHGVGLDGNDLAVVFQLHFIPAVQLLAGIDPLALEQGDVPLDGSLALYTEGAELIRKCTQQLDEAEQTVVKLQKGPDGSPVELPFDTESE